MPHFDVSFYTSQIFWLLIVFSTLYLVVSQFIAPRAEKILKTRQSTINDRVNDATHLHTKAAKAQQRYDEHLAETQSFVARVRNEALAEMAKNLQLRKDKLHTEIQHQRQLAQKEIAQVSAEFNDHKAKVAQELASFIITNVTGKKPDLELFQSACKE